MKKIFINKIGIDHALEWRNCQDYGFINDTFKCVVDGCSEGKHSDVGAKTFCHLFSKNESIDETFKTLTSIYSNFDDIKNHLLFTILFVTEDENNFYVNIAGDGIIIKQNQNNEIEYDVIEQNNSPSYYAYNFVPKQFLKMYQEGVDFNIYTFSKNDYKNIGVATDGLSYLIDSEYKDTFEQFLVNKKENRIRLLLNKIHKEALKHELNNKNFDEPLFLKDDITIVF